MGGKNCKRGVDYRVGLIHLVTLLCDKIYGSESKRSVEMILRLHNQSFLHMTLLKKIVKDTPLSPKLTKKKFYGKYLHALYCPCSHIVKDGIYTMGKSTNAEEEEENIQIIENHNNFNMEFSTRPCYTECCYQASS